MQKIVLRYVSNPVDNWSASRGSRAKKEKRTAAPKESRTPPSVEYEPSEGVKVPTGVDSRLLAMASEQNDLQAAGGRFNGRCREV